MVFNRFLVEVFEEFYDGIKIVCNIYNVDMVGGDIIFLIFGLIISIIVIGEVKVENIVYRSGVKDNDLLVMLGDIGVVYLGL